MRSVDKELRRAIMRNDIYAAEDAIVQGAFIGDVDENGFSPVQLAQDLGFEEMVDFLDSYGADAEAMKLQKESEYILLRYSKEDAKLRAKNHTETYFLSMKVHSLMKREFGNNHGLNSAAFHYVNNSLAKSNVEKAKAAVYKNAPKAVASEVISFLNEEFGIE